MYPVEMVSLLLLNDGFCRHLKKMVIFTSVGTTRGQGIIRVVVIVMFSNILTLWKIFLK